MFVHFLVNFLRILPQFDQLLDQQVNQFHVALTARLGQTVACLPWEKLEVKQDNIYDIYIYITYIHIYICIILYMSYHMLLYMYIYISSCELLAQIWKTHQL
jgi:hypothetical protein